MEVLGGLQVRGSHLLQHGATGLDTAVLATNLVQTAAIDAFGAVATSVGCALGPGGCLAGVGLWAQEDIAVSVTIGEADQVILLLSILLTASSDISAGYTGSSDGQIRIGEGTAHSVFTTLLGFTPETHAQLYFSLKQVLYDFGIDDWIDTNTVDVGSVNVIFRQ